MFGQPSQAGLVRRGMDSGDQSCIGAQAPTVGESCNVANLAADQQRRVSPDPGNGAGELRLAIGRHLLSDRMICAADLSRQVIQLPQIAIEGQPITGTPGHGRQKLPTPHPERRLGRRLHPVFLRIAAILFFTWVRSRTSEAR